MIGAKEYLMKIHLWDARIEASQRELDMLMAMVTRITPVLKDDVVSSSGSQDKLGDTVAKIADLREKINQDIDTLVDMKKVAYALLQKVDRPEYYTILYKRYFMYHSLEQIAVDMNFTYRWVRRLHGRALQAFAKIMQESVDECHKS
jgi:hypothetical protein